MTEIYSKEELAVLDNLAMAIFGCHFNRLGWEEQDDLYCYMEDMELVSRKWEW